MVFIERLRAKNGVVLRAILDKIEGQEGDSSEVRRGEEGRLVGCR